MQIDWQNLGFRYVPTHGFVRVDYQNGEWGQPTVQTEPYLPMHIAANCLHYGQACFEGLKAFRTRENKIAIFQLQRHAERLQHSAERLCMEAPSVELFIEACQIAVTANAAFVPPYGTGASLYIRPLLIGIEPMIGIQLSQHYAFIVIVTPVGPYYKNGFYPVEALVMKEYDRVAMNGLGQAKSPGNYAASLKPSAEAKKGGFPIVLFSDPRENRYVEEFSTSNFIGITKEGVYKTPLSASILRSVTNESLQRLAEEIGLKVSVEPIPLDQLDQFSEVGACGTAAVITPISAIHNGSTIHRFGSKEQAGPTLTALYNAFQMLQYGEREDPYGWMHYLV